MLVENTTSRMERLEGLRERVATAQEEFLRQSLIEKQHARPRWTETTTLVPLVTSCVALVLSLYAVLGSQKRADLPAPVVLKTEARVTHAVPRVGDVGRIGASTTACFELQDYRRIKEPTGSEPAAADMDATQACGMFEPGLQVTVDRVSESDGAVCARQVGLPQCFWISGEAFGKEP